jgi:TRAP-type transport system periplasmic protein
MRLEKTTPRAGAQVRDSSVSVLCEQAGINTVRLRRAVPYRYYLELNYIRISKLLRGRIMKNTFRILTAAMLLSAVTTTAYSVELKFASFTPPQHTITASVVDKLSAGLKADTNGEVSIAYYPGGELGPGPLEQYVRVVQGAADMSWGLQGYTSSQFPKSMVAELPGSIKPGGNGYDMLWNAYEKHLASEYPGVKPLALWTSEPNIIIMKDKQIRTPADLAGLKIRVAGAVAADVIAALGATPIQMPIPQVYNALQTGLIDGIVTGASAVADFKLLEVASSYTIGAPLGRIAFFTVMNKATYDGLSDAHKSAIDAHSGLGLSKSAEDAWNAKANETIVKLKENSANVVIELDEAGAGTFAKITLSVAEAVLKKVNGADILRDMRGE